MGFDEIRFKEDFRGQPVKMSSWGVRDADLFQLSNRKMRQDRGPQFHFIITLDTHAPFDLITDGEKEIFPHSKVWQENYFNSLRVLDNGLRAYIESLPAGTLVMLYGDHTAGVTYGDYHSEPRWRGGIRPLHRACVPGRRFLGGDGGPRPARRQKICGFTT